VFRDLSRFGPIARVSHRQHSRQHSAPPCCCCHLSFGGVPCPPSYFTLARCSPWPSSWRDCWQRHAAVRRRVRPRPAGPDTAPPWPRATRRGRRTLGEVAPELGSGMAGVDGAGQIVGIRLSAEGGSRASFSLFAPVYTQTGVSRRPAIRVWRTGREPIPPGSPRSSTGSTRGGTRLPRRS
jgi:hypothetical protein